MDFAIADYVTKWLLRTYKLPWSIWICLLWYHGGQEKPDGTGGSMYSAVFFINSSYVSSIANVQTSPLALISIFYSVFFFSSIAIHFSISSFRRDSICLYSMFFPLPVVISLFPSFSSSLLSIPIQSPANIGLISLGCRADCSRDKLYAIICRKLGRREKHRKSGKWVIHR